MERFIEDLAATPGKRHPEQYSDFKKVLDQLVKHPNERYFILKSIIINNLFGVDIMEEAVEICKLRLFLKLVAQVETVSQIEPLPDIDFNIRAGNTLVGFASLDQLRESVMKVVAEYLPGTPEVEKQKKHLARIEEDAEMVEKAFRQFRAQQTTHGGKVTREDKQELRNRLAKLDAELDRYLAGEYGVNVEKEKAFEAWKTSHEPFHWFVEFYGIMATGGFDRNHRQSSLRGQRQGPQSIFGHRLSDSSMHGHLRLVPRASIPTRPRARLYGHDRSSEPNLQWRFLVLAGPALLSISLELVFLIWPYSGCTVRA